jgi:hypothetical protein
MSRRGRLTTSGGMARSQLFQFANGQGFVVNIGSLGASLRLPVEGATQPLTIAWLNPPRKGWMERPQGLDAGLRRVLHGQPARART